MALIKVVGHTHIMNEKCNLFSSFIYKIFEKIGFKSRGFLTNRQIETQRVRCRAEPRKTITKTNGRSRRRGPANRILK